MADQATPTYDPSGRVSGYRGSKAGQGFASQADLDKAKLEEQDWADFARSMNLQPAMFSGLGGGAARSRYKSQFDAWRGGGKSTSGGTVGDLLKAGLAK